jgi:hypothetical protein
MLMMMMMMMMMAAVSRAKASVLAFPFLSSRCQRGTVPDQQRYPPVVLTLLYITPL